MLISVTNAQLLIQTLTNGIHAAMARGQSEFDCTLALQATDDAARAELAKAIEDARQGPRVGAGKATSEPTA